MPESAVEILTNMGLPGLVILSLGWWINRQDSRIITLQQRIDTLQELRVEDAQRIAGAVATLGEALERQSNKLDVYLERKPTR